MVGLIIIIGGLVLFRVWRKHLLIRVLRLEYIVLGVLSIFHWGLVRFILVYGVFYLIFTACEGALGLSILVSMRRTHGADYFRRFHLG